MSRRYLGGCQERGTFRCVEGVWRMFGGCPELEVAWRVPGRCQELSGFGTAQSTCIKPRELLALQFENDAKLSPGNDRFQDNQEQD